MKQNLLISMTFVVAGCLGFTAGRMSSSELATSPELPASQPSSLSVAEVRTSRTSDRHRQPYQRHICASSSRMRRHPCGAPTHRWSAVAP